jgi:hypothetical protein
MAFNLTHTFKSALAQLQNRWETLLLPTAIPGKELAQALQAKGWQIEYVLPKTLMPYTANRPQIMVTDMMGRNIQDKGNETLRKSFYDDMREEAAKIRLKNSPRPN